MPTSPDSPAADSPSTEPRDPLGCLVPGGRFVVEGAATGPLKGLDFAAKDIFDVAGHVTGCGNPDWAAGRAPAERHSAPVAALLGAGARLVGKTITDEMAFSLNGQNFHYGTPTNSNAPGRIPGGSSSGSASAVAGGFADTALGSDTGGSIRIPASYCGLYGLRPTHGLIDSTGVAGLAPSFDTVGWFARDARTLARVGAVLLPVSTPAAPSSLLLGEDAWALAEPAAQAALAPCLQRLEARLGKAAPVTLGEPGGGLKAWMLRFRALQGAEIWELLGPWITAAKPRFGPEIQARMDQVRDRDPAEARAAAPLRGDFTAHLEELLGADRFLALPSAPGIAPRLDATAESLVEHRDRVLQLTSIAGLAGLPQISLPVASLEGCPLGLSLIGPRGSDRALLTFAVQWLAEEA